MYKHVFAIFMIQLFMISTFSGSYAQIVETTEETSSLSDSSTIPDITSTEIPVTNKSCEIHNNDCKACVANTECYYCDENDQCHFHVQNIVADGQCNMNHVHFLTCRVSFRTLAIIIGVLIGIAVLIITIFCCYCCCKRKGIKLSKDDLKWARQREERKQIAAERRKERTERTEEIRKKYGLVKDSNPYQRFDA